MLQSGDDSNLFAAYSDAVQDQGSKDAFAYLVGWGAASTRYVCYPSGHGYIKDVRFLLRDKWYFAFVPNPKWLLFYFRRPCLDLPKYSREQILQRFPEAKQISSSGEFKLRITTVQDALRLARYIEN